MSTIVSVGVALGPGAVAAQALETKSGPDEVVGLWDHDPAKSWFKDPADKNPVDKKPVAEEPDADSDDEDPSMKPDRHKRDKKKVKKVKESYSYERVLWFDGKDKKKKHHKKKPYDTVGWDGDYDDSATDLVPPKDKKDKKDKKKKRTGANSVVVMDTGMRTATVDCPTGTFALGGGGVTETSPLLESRPIPDGASPATGWQAGIAANQPVTVFAICAK